MECDRISSLPEALLWYILSFLSTKEAVKTGVLSRRWRDVWTGVPYLNLEEDEFQIHHRNDGTVDNYTWYSTSFASFVDRVLILRDNSKLEKFSLSCSTYCNVSRANLWIHYAKRHFVEQVDLRLYGNFVKYPYPLFTCESLKVMNLDMFFQSIRLPDSIYLPKLEDFQLCSAKISPLGASIQRLISSCPKIQNFRVYCCDFGNVEIIDFSGCSNLEILMVNCKCNGIKKFIVSCHALIVLSLSGFGDFKGCEMQISAPKLFFFYYNGVEVKRFSAQNLSSSFQAVINYIDDGYEDNDFGVDGNGDNEFGDGGGDVSILQNRIVNLVDVLKGLQNAKWLSLSSHKLLSKSGRLLEMQPIFFPSLKSLSISTSEFGKDLVRVIIFILKGSPILETLEIAYKGHDRNRWCLKEEDFPFECTLSHLKKVEIKQFDGSENEVEFAKFILKRAVVLESMDFTNPSKWSACLQRRTVISQELLSYP